MIVGSQIVRSDWFMRVGGFDQDIRFAEDWEFWCRLAAQSKFKFVPNLTVLGYRMQPESMSHHQVVPYERFLPVLDTIFSQPAVRVLPGISQLRRKAETNLQSVYLYRGGPDGSARKSVQGLPKGSSRWPQ